MTGVSKRLWAGVTACGLLAGVVTWLGASPGHTPVAAATGPLSPFDSCEQLRASYVKAALPHVTAWGWDAGRWWPPIAVSGSMPSGAAAGGLEAADRTEAVGNGTTGTNLQERDVDEPDLAKTDGELVTLVRHGDLVVLDASGDEPREVARLDLPDRLRVTELLLVGDRAVLLGQTAYRPPFGPLGLPSTPVFRTGRPAAGSRTTLTTVDLADPASPTLVRTESVRGDLVSAREHDGVVRVVTASLPELDFGYPTRTRTAQEALARNRRVVREAAAEDWLPTTRVDGGAAEPLLACADVRHPEKPAGLGTISVLTMDPTQPDDRSAIGIAAAGDLVYASSDRLYVATTDQGWPVRITPAPVQRSASTDIHAFDVTGDTTRYLGSGEVPGHVADRWAFSAADGRLRVASSVGSVWRPRETRITVLVEHGAWLVPIGSVGGMGRHEQVRAVRWLGDVAIVVTFRQTDPLYTVDLSDPADPTVVGELQMPGFSAYLHPIGGDQLLGVGQDATRSGGLRGAQVSTFDLSDLAHPRRLDRQRLGADRTSATDSDARAFSYLPGDRLAFVPTWSWYGQSTVEVVHVGQAGDLRTVTAIPIPGSAQDARVLPLDDGRVAIVAGGDVTRIADPAAR